MPIPVMEVIGQVSSTYVVRLTWLDEDGLAFTPLTANWTLKDIADAVVNSRSAVSISVPAATNDVVLAGADLPSAGRYELTTAGTYTSAAQVGGPFSARFYFYIE